MALNPPVVININGTTDDSFRIADASGIGSVNTVALQTASGVLKLFKADGVTLAKLQVATPTTGEDVAIKSYVDTVAGTTACEQVLAVSLAFNSAAAVNSVFALVDNAYITKVQVVVNTQFNGTNPTVSVGYTGQTTKFMPKGQNNLKLTGTYTREQFSQQNSGAPQTLLLTYDADGSSAGAATVVVWFVPVPKS